MQFDKIAVVMITRNEERAIEKVILDVRRDLPGCTLFVIDGSSDKTPKIATEMGAIVIREPGGGFGPALHSALHAPGPEFDVIATLDADDTYPTERFREMFYILKEGYDLVGGNRLAYVPNRNMPFLNWVANWMFNLFASAKSKKFLRDVHSGQRMYKREVIHKFDWDFKGYAFPVDLLLWPAISGLKIKEIRIDYRERIGNSTLLRGPSGVATLKRLLRSKKYIKSRIN